MLIENLPLISGILALVFVVYLIFKVMREDPGTEKMQEISQAIHEGAMTFMKREFKALIIFVIVIAILLGYLLGWLTLLSYLLGTFMSSLAGFIGMIIATKTNSRTAHQAKSNFPKALRITFSGGSVMGFSVVGLGLLGLIVIFSVSHEQEVLLAYGFGASSIALFLRVGGGIFTKSADVGADLVGKVEKGIPEDDPRNPAVIADNVGDNVGDIAGMGSDLFESYVSSILAASILGALALGSTGVIFPIILASAGILASIIGTLFVRTGKSAKSFEEQSKSASSALNRGIIASSILLAVFAYYLTTTILNDINIFFAILSGLILGFLIGKITEYYTSAKYGPVKSIASSAQTGPATNIIEGLSVGMISTVLPIILISITTLISYQLAGLFGIAIAAVGMLSTLGMILSLDGYGPIADNAAGIAEMAGLGKETREKCEALDSVGNTTAAIGKGFAISSAALTALAWLVTFFGIAGLETISITNPNVIVGLFIGAMLPFFFSSITLRAVGKGAFEIIKEVRRQFKEIGGLMEGKAKPDYERCIDITTRGAIKEMIKPGVIVLIVPPLIGLILGLEALGGLITGTLISGVMMAIMMANSGGAWDNAKKYIEAGNLGGKGSDVHKAAVVGDTIGDGCKDCSGPSLNILIKLTSIVALIVAMVLL